MIGGERESSGGPDGLLTVVAIAIVLFFAIKIYADYVTATGQAVKPQHGKRSDYDASSTFEPRSQPSNSYDESVPPVEHRRHEPEAFDRADETLARRPAIHRAREQVVLHRRPRQENTTRADSEPSFPAEFRSHRTRTAVETPVEVLKPTANMPLFRYSNPYPADLDDIQLGDRLSQIRELDLPGHRLSRSIYSFRPESGPFKAVYCMFTLGPEDPKVTSVVYFFRDSRSQVRVRQQAIEAFGEGISSRTDRGRRIAWPHLEGYSVMLEPDRYSIEEDLSGGRDESPLRSEDATTQ